MSRDEMVKKLKESLKPDRFIHTLGVEQTAGELAPRYGIDPAQARLAGLLHDCAKGRSPDKMRQLIRQGGIEVDDMEWQTVSLLHAPAGAAAARLEYGVTDEAVLSAIRWHTTGRPHMSPLEELIYLSDVIEPNRPGYPGLDRVREAVRRDLNEAMKLAVQDTVDYVKGNKRQLHSRSLALLDYLYEQEETK